MLDFLVFTGITVAQLSILLRILRVADRRGWSRKSVYAGARMVFCVYCAGAFLSMSGWVSRLQIPPGPAEVFGAGVFCWLLASSAAWCIYWVVEKLTARRQFDSTRRQAINAAGCALAAAPFCAMGYGVFVERTAFRVREIDLPLPGLPADLNGLRLVQVSDIHLSAFLSERELARVVDAANQTRAHVALVTGDLISARGDPLDTCLRQLARLRTDAGTLGCLGNHEIYAHAQSAATRRGARLGISFLRQQNRILRFGGARINIAGVDYQPFFRKDQYLEGAGQMVVPGALNVLLSHNPDVFPVAAAKGYNLTISGHTHGGQVTVEILNQQINPARVFTPYVYGRYDSGPARAYVTRGIGTIGIPARVGAPPEIALLRLRKV